MSQRSSPDLDPSDDSSWPSPADPFAGESCPVCGKLDLDRVVGKDNTRSLEYFIDPSEQSHEILFQWIEKCSLCKLVYDLDQHWSKQGDDVQGMKYDGYIYRFACGRNGSDPLHLEIVVDWGEYSSASPKNRSWSDSTRVYRQLFDRTHDPHCGACRSSVRELYSTNETLDSQM